MNSSRRETRSLSASKEIAWCPPSARSLVIRSISLRPIFSRFGCPKRLMTFWLSRL